jgi:hypothetical protein
MVNATSLDDRPRFGLLDLFAIVAGIAIAVSGLKDISERANRAQSISSIRPPSPRINPPIDWNASRVMNFLLFAAPAGILLAQPLALALQFLARGRRMPITRLEWIGISPSFLVFGGLSLRAATLTQHRPFVLGPAAVLFLGLLLSAVWMFWNRPGDQYSNGISWTDAIGVAATFLVCLGVLIIVAELSR